MDKDLKAKILANLDSLSEKVNFKRSQPQVVNLESNYFDDGTKNSYYLNVECVVYMKRNDYDRLEIDGFYIEQITFFKNEGQNVGFRFTKTELTDYIDY